MNLDEVRNIYARWAPFYNPTHRWSLPKRKLARLALQISPGDRVLDLACGTGINFPHLREMVGESGKVMGLDLSPQMLEFARRLISERGWKNVEVREGDAAGLPFEDRSFDKVICSYSLNVIPDFVGALEEIRRVLVPGGRFVSLEMRTDSGWMPKTWHPCGVDTSHDTLGAIKKVFGNIQLQTYWMGMVFLAIGTKTKVADS
jgi:ubiquinone/menaquinone biosynthesis C-methylase UbiE